ncbi:MAG: ABC transporter ATP-binding protein [Candidatus Sumerlaeia bacterium]|nr:ABC transporter ATP-binding protein [Candidatus Sumerlaeia bacterium]
MSLLKLEKLCVGYGPIEVLHSINITVEEGQTVALLGANGAGKTTTLRAISGLIRPRSGKILFQGNSVVGIPAHKIVSLGLAHVPEGRGIFTDLSVRENLLLGAYTRKDTPQIKADFERTLELFPRLRERLAQRSGTLSGGEQQMLAIGRAYMTRPRLLMLDEPSLGLAPQIVKVIFQIIREINEMGTTILLVEQNANMALKASDYAYVLEVGSVALQDKSDVLAQTEEIKKAYLGGH